MDKNVKAEFLLKSNALVDIIPDAVFIVL